MAERVEFTSARVWMAEGARVGLVTCLTCGAAVLIDPADDESWIEVHRLWHERADHGSEDR